MNEREPTEEEVEEALDLTDEPDRDRKLEEAREREGHRDLTYEPDHSPIGTHD